MQSPIQTPSILRQQILQMAQTLADSLEHAAQQASPGTTLDACEGLLLDQGRQFLRDCLAATLQQEADRAQKKGGEARTCTCGHTRRNKGDNSREFLTALGSIQLNRTYLHCAHCQLGDYPVDERLGFDGRLSTRAQQMATLAGVAQSFRHAGQLLQQLAGWTTCHESLRLICYQQADELDKQRQATFPEVEAFQEASGQMEFQTDATKLNTTGGWRDMKIALFAKRESGPAAAPEQWNQRGVPAPTAIFAFAGIEEIDTFAPKWQLWSERLGLGEGCLSVLGDGAEWIWDHSDVQFANWEGTLDIFHAGEWLSKAAKAGCGEGTAEAARWQQESRLALLAKGYAGLCEYLHQSLSWVPNQSDLEGAAGEVLNYFCGHQQRLNYADRLGRGLPIGSGQIEGACKQLIGKRMKQTKAPWTVSNANRMALLCSLAYADAFPYYFSAA